MHGPLGSGKIKFVHCLCGELKIPLYYVSSSSDLIGGIAGESEKKIKKLFADAFQSQLSVIFLDEIDIIRGRRDQSNKEMTHRMLTQLLSCLDDLSNLTNISQNSSLKFTKNNAVIVIGATSKPDQLDPVLHRAGRLDNEILLGLPSITDRYNILLKLTKDLKIHSDLDLFLLAKLSPGIITADLELIIKEYSLLSIERLKNIFYCYQHIFQNSPPSTWDESLNNTDLSKSVLI